MADSLVDVLRRDIERDPGDAPVLSVEDDYLAQDMGWMIEAEERNVAQRRAVEWAP